MVSNGKKRVLFSKLTPIMEYDAEHFFSLNDKF